MFGGRLRVFGGHLRVFGECLRVFRGFLRVFEEPLGGFYKALWGILVLCCYVFFCVWLCVFLFTRMRFLRVQPFCTVTSKLSANITPINL